MRPAPPLTLELVPSRAWPAMCTALGIAAGAAAAAWLAAHLEWAALPAWMAIVTMALALGAWGYRAAGRRGRADVRWDGQHWWLDGVAGDLQLMLDLQAWMLLRHRPSAGGERRWIAAAGARLPRGAAPAASDAADAADAADAGGADGDRAHWPALRTALYSRALAAGPAALAAPTP